MIGLNSVLMGQMGIIAVQYGTRIRIAIGSIFYRKVRIFFDFKLNRGQIEFILSKSMKQIGIATVTDSAECNGHRKNGESFIE